MDYVPFGTSLWDRPEYVALRPKEKLLCLYLKTNPRLTVSGIYPIAVETVAKAISTYVPYAMMMLASLPGIEYDCEKSCVFVRDHFRAMCLTDPTASTAAMAENAQIATRLWQSFVDEYPEMRHSITPAESPRNDSKRQPDNHLNEISRTQKRAYSNYVRLTVEDYEALGHELGSEMRDRCIQRLSTYKKNRAKEYDNDIVPIRKWVIKAVQDEMSREEIEGGAKRQVAKCVWLREAEFKRLGEAYGVNVRNEYIRKLDDFKMRTDWAPPSDYNILISWIEGRLQGDKKDIQARGA